MTKKIQVPMTKVLFVTGDSDFSAQTFEESKHFKTIKSLWRKVSKEPKFELEIIDKENDHVEIITFVALEFDEVTKDFVDWLKDEMIDYDMSKAKNFYVVE